MNLLRCTIFLKLLLIFNFCTIKCLANDVLGCGGYVRSEVEIDFSQVHLRLLTQQGNLKYETECAPNNGYYFIPLYDRGHYILKVVPPAGWSFEPEEVVLKVDGENDPCSKNEDINFIFKGFAIFGRVVTSGSEIGPAGVTVTLKQGVKEISQTTTTEKGNYKFTPLAAGSYNVIASHDSWKIKNNKVSVDVVDKNGNAGSGLVVAGYFLSGSVLDTDKQLMPKIKFVLHSAKEVRQEIGCQKDKLKGYEAKLKPAVLCYTSADHKGHFTFLHLPLGKYTLVPWIDSPDVKYDIGPSSVHVEIGHEDFVLKEPFKINGRDFRGRILTGKNSDVGIDGAVVSLTDDVVTKTDKNGQFIFPKLQYGDYVIKVDADGYEFQDNTLNLNAESPAQMSIAPSRYRVCFSVSIDSASDINIPWMISVIGTNSDDKIQTGSSGTSCIHLVPGEYKSSVVLSPQDKEAGIRFGPVEHEFTVDSNPIENLAFAQFLAEINGVIHCLESCRSLIVTLRPSKDSSGSLKTATSVQEKFSFKEVVPGDYLLSVDKEEWCWKNQTYRMLVNKKNVVAKFVQTGFKLTLNSSHRTSLSYVTNHGHKGKLNVSEGTTRECVSAPGKYVFTSAGCHQYASANLAWDTSSPQLLSLVSTHHKVTGTLVSNEPGPFTLTMKSNRRSDEVLGPLQPSSTFKDVYVFEAWMMNGETATFTPSSSSNLFQYTPPNFTVDTINDCLLAAVEFTAERALFFKGYVKPPIKGVTITVLAEERDNLVYNTNLEGFFIAGPLDKSLNYSVTAEKLGYTITPPIHKVEMNRENSPEIVKLNFDAYKLAEILVTVLDEFGNPLEGVLVSTSGGKDYRQNSLTESDGVFAFKSLMPSDYFIRPMMKEYLFEPASKMVKVEAGATVAVEVRGKRIAYSIWGQTISLSGDAEGDVVMEAIGVGQECQSLQEEALSDPQGHFRIRGLIPNCDYKLQLKEGDGFNEHVERSMPKEKLVRIGASDEKDIKVVVIRPFLQMDVAIIVDTEPEFLSQLTAEVYRDDAPDSPIQVISLGQHPFFMLPPMMMDKKTYTVQLASTLSHQHYSYSLSSTTFIANESFIRRSLTFKPVLRNIDAEISRSTVFSLLFFALLVLVVLNYSRIQPLVVRILEDYYSSANMKSSKSSVQSPSSATSSFIDSVGLKKRVKSRKT